MGIAGTNLGAIIGSQIGVNTDWQQPNGGGGGGESYPEYGEALLGLAYESRSDPVGGSGSYYGLASSSNSLTGNNSGFLFTNILSGYTIREIALGTPISSSSATNAVMSTIDNPGATRYNDFALRPDGTVLYGMTSGGDVHEYEPDTPYRGDSSTGWSAAIINLSTVFTAESWRGLAFSGDGTKLYGYGTSGNLHIATMSTAWDLTSAVDDSNPLATGLGGAIYGIDVTPDSNFAAFCSDSGNLIRLWGVDTAVEEELGDISAATELATYDVYTLSGNLNQGPLGVAFDVWNKKLFVIDYIDDRLYQFSWTGEA